MSQEAGTLLVVSKWTFSLLKTFKRKPFISEGYTGNIDEEQPTSQTFPPSICGSES